eukprot:6366560-Prymnesium_polylepis.1
MIKRRNLPAVLPDQRCRVQQRELEPVLRLVHPIEQVVRRSLHAAAPAADVHDRRVMAALAAVGTTAGAGGGEEGSAGRVGVLDHHRRAHVGRLPAVDLQQWPPHLCAARRRAAVRSRRATIT